MNQKVKEFLEKAKAEEAKQAEEEKKNILISAGLFEKEYSKDKHWSEKYPKYDEKEWNYYRENPIDVTEEEYTEILKHTTAQKNKEEKLNATPENDGAEKSLNTIAVIILVCGIIASIICFAEMFIEFELSELGIALSILIISIATWAMMKVFANISISLKELNSKIKK